MANNYLVSNIRQLLSGANPNMPANITFGQLLKLLDAIEFATPTPGGSGLAVTGLDNGATVQDQVFQQGVTLGSAGAIIGVLNFKNSEDGTTIIVNSTNSKELLIDKAGHDVQVGINTAGVAGVALAVGGDAQIGLGGTYSQGLLGTDLANKKSWIGDRNGENNSTRVLVDDSTAQTIDFNAINNITIHTGLGSVILEGGTNGTTLNLDDFAQTVQVNAANGVSTSAGLTVGTTIKTSIENRVTGHTLGDDIQTTFIDAAADADFDLPSAATYSGLSLTFCCVNDNGNLVRVSTISPITLTTGQSVTVTSNGTDWYATSKY